MRREKTLCSPLHTNHLGQLPVGPNSRFHIHTVKVMNEQEPYMWDNFLDLIGYFMPHATTGNYRILNLVMKNWHIKNKNLNLDTAHVTSMTFTYHYGLDTGAKLCVAKSEEE